MWIRFGGNEKEDEGEKDKGERKFQRTKENKVGLWFLVRYARSFSDPGSMQTFLR